MLNRNLAAFGLFIACFSQSHVWGEIGAKDWDISVDVVKVRAGGKPPDPNPVIVDAAITWINIPGGQYTMGSDVRIDGIPVSSYPLRRVSVKGFQMSKTLVTVDQYAKCVDAGACAPPMTTNGVDSQWRDKLPNAHCNWGKRGRGNHPVNCIDWNQAQAFVLFTRKQIPDVRLPSEAEWEYAAGGVERRTYPWGEESPSCDRAVMANRRGYGCGTGETMPVCSKPRGNTPQGLCDMAGNLFQWMQDLHATNYRNAPVDGSAHHGPELGGRVIRGSAYLFDNPELMRVNRRGGGIDENTGFETYGFRLAR